MALLNPQPLPPKATIDFVALNPQPLPPNGTLDFVAVAARPADRTAARGALHAVSRSLKQKRQQHAAPPPSAQHVQAPATG